MTARPRASVHPRDGAGQELWEFDADAYMRRREASINDAPIAEADLRVTPGEGDLPPF